MSVRAQHVVLFKFPRELTADEESEMATQIAAWPENIQGFTGLRFGKDTSGRSGGFTYLLLTEFENEDAHQAYYSQPSHVAFSEWVFARDCEVIRVDYPLTPDHLILDT
ncbi:MAG: Stress responsive Barrel Domain [Actinomycetota bacterium]|jgi:heme-degrading monooxygenase HmoA|nr:Stress responsive Barrel Domain [Actinomycetota bacterium]